MSSIKEILELIEKIKTEMKNYKEEFRSKLPKIYSKVYSMKSIQKYRI